MRMSPLETEKKSGLGQDLQFSICQAQNRSSLALQE